MGVSSEVDRHFSVRPPNSRMFQVATSRLRSAFLGISRDSCRRSAVSWGYGCGGFYLSLRVLAEEFELDRDPMAEAFNRATGLLAE